MTSPATRGYEQPDEITRATNQTWVHWGRDVPKTGELARPPKTRTPAAPTLRSTADTVNMPVVAASMVATIVVASGVGALVNSVPMALTALTVVGSVYLIWLGVSTLRQPSTIRPADQPTSDSPLRQLATGFGVSGLNPKVFLLFLALLPQFTRPDAPWSVPAQMLMLGGIHVANCAVIYLLVAATAKRLLVTRPAAGRIVSRTSGLIMTLLGAWLLTEQILPLLGQSNA